MSIVETNDWMRTPSAPTQYPVNIRITIPFLPRPAFMTLIIGPERRGTTRRRQERQRHPLNTWGNLAILLGGWAVLNIAALFVAMVASGV